MLASSSKVTHETEILYEISLSIGASLDLNKMLQAVLSKMLRGLNCNIALVLKYESDLQDTLTWQQQITLPKTARKHAEVATLLQKLTLPETKDKLTRFENELPEFVSVTNNEFYYLFSLEGFGVLILRKTGAQFSHNLLSSLSRMMPKLAQACHSCLHEHNLRMQMQTANAANIAKSQFLARMSHEIRTPMNGVLGMLALLLETNLTKEQTENIKLAEFSATNLLQIINDILDLSRIEAGKHELYPQETDLFTLVGKCIKSLASRAWEKNLNIDYQIGPSVPRFITIDPNKLKQILINLLGNAVKFTHKGEVCLTIAVLSHSHQLSFSVTDTGIGIEQANLEKVFKPFEQEDEGINRLYEGTGLGLAIVKELVECMHGTITVESKIGEGSTFRCLVPLLEAPKATIEYKSIDAPLVSNAQLLLLSAGGNACLTLQALLTGLGQPYQVVTDLETLYDCLSKNVQNANKSLLIIDCDDLPNSTSMQGIHDIIIANPDARFINIHCDIKMRNISPEAGHDNVDYICRPFSINELENAIGSGMDHSMDHRLDHSTNSALDAGITNKANANPQTHVLHDKPLNNLRVLVVDDKDVNLRIAAKLLQNKGCLVDVAKNGQEALEILVEKQFDLVFMDVMMPILDGLSATKLIREREVTQKLPHQPIIAMTANAMQGDRDRCIDAGMDGYVSKPIAINDIVTEVDKVLGNLRSRPSHSAVHASQDTTHAEQPETILNIDWAKTKAYLNNDEELIAEVISCYVKETPSYITDLRKGADNQDATLVQEVAHIIKTMAAMFSIATIQTQAQEIEKLAQQGSIDPLMIKTIAENLNLLHNALLSANV